MKNAVQVAGTNFAYFNMKNGVSIIEQNKIKSGKKIKAEQNLEESNLSNKEQMKTVQKPIQKTVSRNSLFGQTISVNFTRTDLIDNTNDNFYEQYKSQFAPKTMYKNFGKLQWRTKNKNKLISKTTINNFFQTRQEMMKTSSTSTFDNIRPDTRMSVVPTRSENFKSILNFKDTEPAIQTVKSDLNIATSMKSKPKKSVTIRRMSQ